MRILASAIFFAIASSAWAANVPSPATAPKIAAIHAQLYYEGDGTFSKDVLTEKDLTLWNTIIGEGGSGGASNFTLVTVEVQGKDVPVGSLNVRIEARDPSRKIIAVKTSNVSIYDEKTKFMAPLFLYDTGCEEIEISAYLMGKGIKKHVVKAKIPFHCGE